MALINGKLFLVLLISALMANTATVISGRNLATTVHYPIGHNLAARINGEDGGGAGMTECWSALYELRSCTNEIILFFMDGEMRLQTIPNSTRIMLNPYKRQRLNNGQPCAPSTTTATMPWPSIPDFDFTGDEWVDLTSSDDVLPVLPAVAENINTSAADNSYNYCNFSDSLLEGSNDEVLLQQEECNLDEFTYSLEAELEEESSNEPVSESDHVKTVDVVLDGNLRLRF